MLLVLVKRLDAWVAARNLEARSDGLLTLRPCRIRLLGQMALFEQRVPLHLVATNHVDVYADYEHAIEKELARMLSDAGKVLDPLGHEIWMPRETRYETLFEGAFVTLQVADPDSVLLSKALKAPDKNRSLIIEYLAGGPSERFLTLARRYKVDLEQFL
jgi:hypothetical protein